MLKRTTQQHHKVYKEICYIFAAPSLVFVAFVLECRRLNAEVGLFDVFIVQELLPGAA